MERATLFKLFQAGVPIMKCMILTCRPSRSRLYRLGLDIVRPAKLRLSQMVRDVVDEFRDDSTKLRPESKFARQYCSAVDPGSSGGKPSTPHSGVGSARALFEWR